VLQCVAVYCRVPQQLLKMLQSVQGCCSVLQCDARLNILSTCANRVASNSHYSTLFAATATRVLQATHTVSHYLQQHEHTICSNPIGTLSAATHVSHYLQQHRHTATPSHYMCSITVTLFATLSHNLLPRYLLSRSLQQHESHTMCSNTVTHYVQQHRHTPCAATLSHDFLSRSLQQHKSK